MSMHQSDMASLGLAGNEWSAILDQNREAHDLLANAIAHHEQHFSGASLESTDPSKQRKGHLHHKNDVSNPETFTFDETQQFSENEGSSDGGNSPGDGKPAPKKAGRKPLTTEPTNKRKAQNRAAQRAFRERKERYVKSLEDRIKELEDSNPANATSQLAEENLNLKVLVQKLETENYILKEQSFTFDFPINQPGTFGSATQKQTLNSLPTTTTATTTSNTLANITSTSSTSSSPDSLPSLDAQSPLYTGDSNLKALAQQNFSSQQTQQQQQQPQQQTTPYEHNLPWTPPSSGGDSVPNSPLDHDLPTPEQESITQVSYSDNGIVPRFKKNTPEELAMYSSLLETKTTNNPNNNIQFFDAVVVDQSPATNLATFSDNGLSPSVHDLMNTPLFETDKDGNATFTPPTASMSMPTLTFEQTRDLFTDFRDPSDSRDFFAGYDDAAETAGFNAEALLFNDQILDYTNFANVNETPAREEKEFFGQLMPVPLVNVKVDEKVVPCPQAWELISKHKKFDDLDIDDLCAELKAKAKCTGHGPMIAEKDVRDLISRLDQH